MTRRPPALALPALLLGAVLLAAPMDAQPPSPPPPPADTTHLDPVVVTATRLATPRSEIPASVTVLRGEELERRGVRFVADALRGVPGAAVVQPGSPGAVTSLFLRGGESDYVKVLVDGVPVNQPGGSYDWAHLTTDNVERIEVVRGPASVLYGSDAVTGVVQIFTRQGRGTPAATLGVEGGSLGTVRWTAGLGGGTERVQYAADVARFASDGMLNVNNHYANLVGSARILARPDPRTDVALAVRGGDATYEFPTDGAGVIADSNQFTTLRSTTVSLDAGRRLARHVEARLLAGLYSATSGLDDRPDSPADTTGFGFAQRRTGTVRRSTLDARVNVDVGPPGTVLTAGAALELEREEQLGQASSNFGGGVTQSSSAFDADRRNTGYYVQAVAPLPHDVALTLGARLDDNQVFGSFTTYRAGVAWSPLAGTRLRASVGNAFKAPTFAEQFAASPFEVGNPALEPERSTSWEGAVEQALFGGRATLAVTAFGQRFRDLIQYHFVDAVTPSYVNVAEARSDGVEAELRARPLSTLDVAATMSWLRTRVRDAGFSTAPGDLFVRGARLVRRPSRSAGATVRWTPVARATLGAAMTYVGERDDVDFREFPSTRVTLPGYALWDFSADVALLTAAPHRPRVAATLRVQNAFDRRYDAIVGFPGMGRVTLVGLRVGP
ncbi:MAG TPA: TonB-dependent receptor [Gemmatimonadaceae bacterium]|nr:TonB-dependent receptor [Gemmatimonadaceae bacterium]